MRREIIIDGKNFDDIAGFYCEIENVFTMDLGWKIGRNLDAFNDVLHGGFGVHEYGEPIKVIWKNFGKSKKDLGCELTNVVVQIITDNAPGHKDCVLETLE